MFEKTKLRNAFRAGGIYRTVKANKRTFEVLPQIHSVKSDKDHTQYVFTLPNGVDPKELTKKEYVFKQVFGDSYTIKGDYKKFVLTVFNKGITSKYPYKFDYFKDKTKGMKLPVICGIDINGQLVYYDITGDPNILIGGRPGWGKSAYIRALLTFWIQLKNEKELHLYLADLKGSELVLFKDVKHVKGFEIDEEPIERMLGKVIKELDHRKYLLNKYSVPHIHDLPEKVPYIVVVIDEFQDLSENDEINTMVQKIAAKGRANGIYIIEATQRPSADITKGIIKANLNVSMAFRTKNKLNSNIILDNGAPDSSKLRTEGRMIVSLHDYIEVQAPWIEVDEVKKTMVLYKKDEKDITDLVDYEEIEDSPMLGKGPLDE